MERKELEKLSASKLREISEDKGLPTKTEDGISLRKSEMIERLVHVLVPKSEPPPSAPAPKAEPAPEPKKAAHPPPLPGADAPEEFAVAEHGRFVVGGIVYEMAKGTVVSANTHDLKALRAQGIKLVPGKRQILDPTHGTSMPHVEYAIPGRVPQKHLIQPSELLVYRDPQGNDLAGPQEPLPEGIADLQKMHK